MADVTMGSAETSSLPSGNHPVDEVLPPYQLAVLGLQHVLVMYAGAIVELAPAEQLFSLPRHPYTAALLESVPRLDAKPGERLAHIEGQPPRPHERLQGCPFAPRCAFARERCRETEPRLEWRDGRASACHAPLPGGWTT